MPPQNDEQGRRRITTPGGADMARPVVYICGIDPAVHVNGHVSYVLAHAVAAGRAGFAPHVFCVGKYSEVVQTEYGVLHRVRTPARHYLLAPVYRRPIATAIADYLETCGYPPPHLIHSFGPWAASAASASAVLARRRIATVTVASAYTTILHEWEGMRRGVGEDHSLRRTFRYRGWDPWVRTVATRVERHGIARATLVLVNYDSVARLLRESCDPGVQIRRFPYASLTAFSPDSPSLPVPDPTAGLRPPGAPLVVSVSRHVPRKGVDLLLRALAGLSKSGISYRAALVGPGRLLNDHRRLAAKLGLGEQVAIPGLVPDVTSYLRQADIFVLPSLEEGSGSVALLEALQAGLAVVASSCDGIPEDLVDGEHALLVPPGNEPALGRALARLLADRELRAELATNARRLYLDRFSPEPLIAALGDLYVELGVRS